MAKVSVLKPNGETLGYFVDPKIEKFQEGEYEIIGQFFYEDGTAAERLEFNPQALPYHFDLSQIDGIEHQKLGLGYVQKGRQPVKMSAVANAPIKVY
jgi:hypothetical protein